MFTSYRAKHAPETALKRAQDLSSKSSNLEIMLRDDFELKNELQIITF